MSVIKSWALYILFRETTAVGNPKGLNLRRVSECGSRIQGPVVTCLKGKGRSTITRIEIIITILRILRFPFLPQGLVFEVQMEKLKNINL